MKGSSWHRRVIVGAATAGALLVFAPLALAHIERASYWPDPGVDTAGGQPTGGAVPEVRSLFSALDASAVGDTRVVCASGQALASRPDQEVSRERVDRLERRLAKVKRAVKNADDKDTRDRKVRKKKRVKRKLNAARQEYDAAVAAEQAARQQHQGQLATHPSMQRLDEALADARANGYELRPSEPPIQVSQAEAEQLRDFNAALLAQCRYDSIQAAVTDSRNNDRVVVMPGIYTEPDSRAAPTNDPSCDRYEEVNDRPGDGEGGLQTGANTFTYVANCPNDQNLIAVVGRETRHDQLPPTPLDDRHGIPDEGPCFRCNLQLEGSGVSPDDVIVDAGNVAAGNGGPGEPVKDVGIRADRADGFVLSNMTVRHVREHGIYAHEVDGYVLQRFKTFHAEEYGTLQFTSDHALVQDCETYGAGDAGIYPGSAPDTGEQVVAPDTERLNTEIRRCDSHHNLLGYSGTAANAVWIHHNDFYDNSLGLVTDVITAAGHPGFPQDSDLIEHNEFYSNNFNPYVDQPANDEVVATLPIPVGTGMWILGGNGNEFRNNHVWDNWRRGVMLSSVNDALVCGDNPVAAGNQQAGCNPNAPPEQISTSYRNEFHDNVMGRSPDGVVAPNGDGNVAEGRTDFWWDQWLGSNTNCWYDNVGKENTAGSVTSTPPAPLLPSSCDPLPSTGTGGAFGQESEVYGCFVLYVQGLPNDGCEWYTTPPEP